MKEKYESGRFRSYGTVRAPIFASQHLAARPAVDFNFEKIKLFFFSSISMSQIIICLTSNFFYD